MEGAFYRTGNNKACRKVLGVENSNEGFTL